MTSNGSTPVPAPISNDVDAVHLKVQTETEYEQEPAEITESVQNPVPPTVDNEEQTNIPVAEVFEPEVIVNTTTTPAPVNQPEIIDEGPPPLRSVEIWEVFYWCLFGGWFGAHQFHLKRPLRGVLYLGTLGFLGVAYVIDVLRFPILVANHASKKEAKRLQEPYLWEPTLYECYVYTIPFGMLGGQQFYLGNYVMGILYFCTLGFLGVGYIHDILFLHANFDRAQQSKRKNFIRKHGEETYNKAKTRNQMYLGQAREILGLSKKKPEAVHSDEQPNENEIKATV